MNTLTTFSVIATSLLFANTAFAQSESPNAALPKELVQSHQKAKSQIAEQGYFEQLDRIPVSEYMLARIEDRRTEHQHLKKPMVLETLGFQEIKDYNMSKAPFALNKVPQDAIKADSTNFILPTNSKVRRIYTKTDFGVLFVEQGIGEMELDEPNLEVAGNDAKIVTTKHRDGKWATTLYAADAGYIYRVEANQRLLGKNLEEFVAYADRIVRNK